jgi:signal transduction histidine kinase/FixJ family two-component response regulator
VHLDIRTLFVVYIAVSAWLTLVMALFWRLRRATPGWGVWTVAVGLTTVGTTLVVLRDAIPDFLSIVVGNGLVLLGTLMIWNGLRIFGRRRSRWGVVAALTLVLLAILSYFRFVSPDLKLRFIAASLSMVISFGACAVECWRNAGGRPHAMDRVAAVLFTTMALAAVARTVLLGIDTPADAFGPTLGQQLNFTAIIVDAVAVVMCLLTMASDRLLRQVEERGETLQRLAEDRDRAAARAERANEAKSRFLAMMSHEVRTPMTGVVGAADLLLTLDDNPERLGHLRALRASAGALMKLLDEILDFSRIEAGKLSIAPASVDAAALLAEVRALFVPAAAAKGLDIAITVGPGVPALVRADPTRLRQVLLNLVGNAVKFTDKGGIDLSLFRARGSEDGGGPDQAHLVFAITDTGIGMDRSQVERLFQPFEQADASVAQRYGGTGLGLAISDALAHAMGGRIDVESRAGEGSVFRLHLPCTMVRVAAPASAPEAAAARAEPPARAAAEPLAQAAPDRRAAILLADDEPTNRGLIAAVLRHMGHAVHEVENGNAAVAAAAQGGFDLVILDMRMPGLDGPSAARAIRALPPPAGAVRIIGLSADAMAAERERYMGAGLDAYLTKPVEWPELRAQVDTALARPAATAPSGAMAAADRGRVIALFDAAGADLPGRTGARGRGR